jgi:peptide/nickel transport system permease protein
MIPHFKTILLVLLLLFGLLPFGLIHFGERSDPYRIDVSKRYQPPSLAHPFGTDDLGRNAFARTLLATGLSLSVVGRSLLVAFVLAVVLGGIAGLYRGRLPDHAISYLIALLHTIPFILISVALAAVLQASIGSIYLIIGCIAWAAPARLVRAEVMRLREARFVQAQRAFGLSPAAIFCKSILPLTVLPPFIGLLYLTPELVGIDVGLSYFGLGAQPPTPTVGRLIYDGINTFRSAWWLIVMPSAMLMAFILVLYGILDVAKSRRKFLIV